MNVNKIVAAILIQNWIQDRQMSIPMIVKQYNKMLEEIEKEEEKDNFNYCRGCIDDDCRNCKYGLGE